MRRRLAIVVSLALMMVPAIPALAAPATATAPAAATATAPAAAKPAKPPKAAKPATRTYDLDFTLPTAGRSGCLVCHGDPNLAKVGAETTSSIFVDIERLRASAHAKNTPCTGCHLDFAYTSPHKRIQGAEDWVASARLACKNCHAEAFSDHSNGVHSLAGKPGVSTTQTAASRAQRGMPAKVPLCGDCHGGHAITAPDDAAGRRALHSSGIAMCGQCHERETASYDDYYHGAAYRRGSLDAPSCWDCHGFHQILPSSDRHSPVHPNQLAATCGQESCHDGADEAFTEYAQLIHGQAEIRDANPLVLIVNRAKQTVREALDTVRSSF